ncbi:MAG: hypothetical protein EAY69_04850 [Cytophagales bacterium]|nr:MAG: hypothetical protein EAY69_04850 [Cytophagales bacterium]
MDNYLYVTDTIHQKYYYRTAMIPTMPWKDNAPPETPQNSKKIYTEKRVILKWETAHTTLPQEKAVYYVVYRFEEIDKKDKDEKIIDKLDFEDAKNIVSIQRETIFYEKLSDKKYKYFVSAVDRLHNESKAIEVVE